MKIFWQRKGILNNRIAEIRRLWPLFVLVIFALFVMFSWAADVGSGGYSNASLKEMWYNATLAENASGEYINKTHPIIKIKFEEEAELVAVDLYKVNFSALLQDPYIPEDLSDKIFSKLPLSGPQVQEDKVFIFQPYNHFEDGPMQPYFLVINATDIYGNPLPRLKLEPFVVDTVSPVIKSMQPSHDDVVTTNSIDFSIMFNESVELKYVLLNNQNLTSDFYLNAPNSTYNSFYSMTKDLGDGHYSMQIKFRDRAGNNNVQYTDFIVNAQPLNIWVDKPELRVSNQQPPFNVTIKTDEPANCRWSYSPGQSYGLMESDSFYDEMQGYGNEHVIKDFEGAQSTSQIGNPNTIYVACKDTYGAINNDSFDIYYDTSQPHITVEAVPNPIIETTRNTTLKVNSDDRVFCKFDNDTTDFNLMANYFQYVNDSDFSAYTNKPSAVMNFPNTQGDNVYSFPQNVICKNLAGEFSELKNYVINVDLDSSLQIQMVSPEQYLFQTDNIILNISTNKYASPCLWSNTSIEQKQYDFENSDGYHHTYTFSHLENGEYDIEVKCQQGTDLETETFSFTVDDEKPKVENISVTPPCSNEELMISWEASYNILKIDEYLANVRYKVDANNITKITDDVYLDVDDCDDGTCTGDGQISDLELVNGGIYFVTMKPIAKTGITTFTKESPNFVVDTERDECLEEDPPVVDPQIDHGEGYSTIGFGCQDASGCNYTGSLYGVSGQGEECYTTTSYAEDMKFNITQDSKICYMFYDKLGNFANDTLNIKVCSGPSCNDGVKNQDETDVDCGGNCSPCSSGPTCSAGDGCKVGCDPVDPDCGGGTGSTCDVGDGCKPGCDPIDPDCGSGTCSEGDVCLAGCDPVDPDCGNGSCSADDICMVGCDPVDPDCGSSNSTCMPGDGCAGGQCVPPDPDCDGATCSEDDICLAGCDPVDPDCLGGSCEENSDCLSGFCYQGHCMEASCEDGIINNGESDVDCGGPNCQLCYADPTCAEGDGCKVGCAPVDPDCGGDDQSTCSPGDGCKPGCAPVDPDCGEGSCSGGDVCLAGCAPVDPDCHNASCSSGDVCMIGCNPVDPDCGSSNSTCMAGDGCAGGQCVPPDTDCDGASCSEDDVCLAGCEPIDLDCLGDKCNMDSDCVTGYCHEGHCSEASCNDSIINQDETDVDCGGSVCQPCGEGKGCLSSSDCATGYCKNGECVDDPDKDSDGDGMPDWWEEQHDLDPEDASDAAEDKDDDGLTNLEEYRVKSFFSESSDPTKRDSDGDGHEDGREYNAGTDPTNPNDYPKINWLRILLLIIGIILVLTGGGYSGYAYYLRTEAKKNPLKRPQQNVSAGRRPPQPMPRPNMPGKRMVSRQRPRMSPEQQRRMRLQQQRYEQYRKQKEREREKYFEKFGSGKSTSEKKPEKPSDKSSGTESESYPSLNLTGWVPLEKMNRLLAKHGKGEVKKTEEKSAPGTENIDKIEKLVQSKDVFSKLSKVSSDEIKKSKVNEQDIFKKLSELKNKNKVENLSTNDIYEKSTSFAPVLANVQVPAKKEPAKTTQQKAGESKDSQSKKEGTKTTKKESKEQDKSLKDLESVAGSSGKEEQSEVFKKLSAITQQKLNQQLGEYVKKQPAQNKSDLVKMFADISTNKNKATTLNVFQTMLKYLLDSEKINKKDIYDVMDQLRTESILSDKDVGSVLYGLGLVKKSQ